MDNIKLKNKLTEIQYRELVKSIIELFNKHSLREICKQLNISDSNLHTIIKDENITLEETIFVQRSKKAALSFEEREKNFAISLHEKDNTKVYYGGFTNIDSKVFIKCLNCGSIYEIPCQAIRRKHKSIFCKECERRRLEESRKRKEKLRKRKIEYKSKLDNGIKELRNKNKFYKKSKQLKLCICKNCGDIFCGDSSYCSQRCIDRSHEHRKTRKRIKRARANGHIDNDITLDKLIKRDNNICYLCGRPCDKADFSFNENNTFIVGRLYPTIDHVKPIAKGGTHTWNNIKLAHHICNSIKSDKTLELQRL